MTTHSYREAGVDIDLEAAAVQALLAQLTFRRRGSFPMHGGVGHFAGLIEFGEMALALAVDGVGTKMLIADRLHDWTTVGIDCIAMNVNDLYVMNMEPVAFVDYIATDTLSVDKMAQIGVGLNRGAELANLNIIGGETATLNGLVNGLDLAGTCLGVQQRDRIVTGERIATGDAIIGVPSSGIHSNGLTLARKLVEEHASFEDRLPGGTTFGEELLTPTRIYAEALQIAAAVEVHGMCHITGGGLRNLNRLGSTGFSITDPLPPQPIFAWMADAGGVAAEEMYRTFNMGMGYVFIVAPEAVDAVTAIVPDARVVGEIVAAPGVWLEETEIT
ncbi:MAG: phosphoribosylformylglycinamidine cyclo-ligase [Methanomicrobiaceae archaeon]|nr:phosphoribosylformylglycinamidine cyclo-ligase [Methanomicrobiaceae archaeon]